MSLIEVQNLVKEYRSHWTYTKKKGGLKGVSFSVSKGESFALLGANGAGKTTTIKCILDLIHKTSGLVKFDSEEIVNKSKLAYLPEQPYFYQHLSVYETLELYAGLYGLRGGERNQRIESAMSALSIGDFRARRLKTLSKGQLQRVGIAQTLLNDPDLLILDEPFSGLDPIARVEIKNLFKKLHGEGKTLIICSHVLSEIEELCDRAIILKEGKVCKEVFIHALQVENPETQEYRILCATSELPPCILQAGLKPMASRQLSQGIYEIEFSGRELAQNVLQLLTQNKISIIEYTKKQQSLEDIFVEISQGSTL